MLVCREPVAQRRCSSRFLPLLESGRRVVESIDEIGIRSFAGNQENIRTQSAWQNSPCPPGLYGLVSTFLPIDEVITNVS